MYNWIRSSQEGWIQNKILAEWIQILNSGNNFCFFDLSEMLRSLAPFFYRSQTMDESRILWTWTKKNAASVCNKDDPQALCVHCTIKRRCAFLMPKKDSRLTKNASSTANNLEGHSFKRSKFEFFDIDVWLDFIHFQAVQKQKVVQRFCKLIVFSLFLKPKIDTFA